MGVLHWLDVAVLVVGCFYVWYAWGKGIYESIGELLVWMTMWMAVVIFWQPMSYYLVRFFGITMDWAPFVVLLFMVSLVGLMTYLVFREIAKKMSRQHFSMGWHLLMGVPINAAAAGLMVMMLMLLLVSIPVIDFGALQAESSWFVNCALEVTRMLL